MKARTSCRMAGLLAFLASLCMALPVAGQTAREIAQKTFPSVVLLVMEDANGQPVSLGSGFFVRKGVVATNLHLVEGAARGYAKVVGKRMKHDVRGIVGIDRKRDLVLLSVPTTSAPTLAFGDSGKVAVGDEVYVVGNPMGLEGTFSRGIVSGIRSVGEDTLFQITAPISPGSSGGPVLDAKGAVVGIAYAGIRPGQNLNFAVPTSYLASLVCNIKPAVPLSEEVQPPEQKPITGNLDRPKALTAVQATLAAWQAAWNGKDTDGVIRCYSRRNAIRKQHESGEAGRVRLKDQIRSFPGKVTLRLQRVTVRPEPAGGDPQTAEATVRLTVEAEGIEEHRTATMRFVRERGEWLILEEGF